MNYFWFTELFFLCRRGSSFRSLKVWQQELRYLHLSTTSQLRSWKEKLKWERKRLKIHRCWSQSRSRKSRRKLLKGDTEKLLSGSSFPMEWCSRVFFLLWSQLAHYTRLVFYHPPNLLINRGSLVSKFYVCWKFGTSFRFFFGSHTNFPSKLVNNYRNLHFLQLFDISCIVLHNTFSFWCSNIHVVFDV